MSDVYVSGGEVRQDGSAEAWLVGRTVGFLAMEREVRLAVGADGTLRATRTDLVHPSLPTGTPRPVPIGGALAAFLLVPFGDNGGYADEAPVRAALSGRDVGKALDRLDRDVLRTLRAVGEMTDATWAALATRGDRAAANAALREWPFLADWFGEDEGFDDAVATGAPARFLAEFGTDGRPPVAKGLARRLLGVRVDARDRRGFLRKLAALPVDLVPTTKDDWKRAFALADAVDDLPGYVALTRPGRTLRQDYDTAEGLRFHETVIASRKPLSSLTNTDFRDVTKAFHEDVVAPALACLCPGSGEGAFDPSSDLWEASMARAETLLLEGKTASDVFVASERWHRTSDAIEAALPAPRRLDLSWRPATASSTFRVSVQTPPFAAARKSTVEVACLASVRALRDEGMAMRHCVGVKTYARACAAGRSAILSLREVAADGGRTPIATVELVGGGSDFRVAQFRGVRNAKPSALASETFYAWRQAVASGKLTFAFPPSGPEGIDLCYDFADEGNVTQARDAWASYLRPDDRTADLEGLLGEDLVAMAREADEALAR